MPNNCFLCGKEIKKDRKMCFECFKASKNLREIKLNEIILDCDNKDGFGNLAIRQIGLMMSVQGYRIEVWEHGGKSYHAHIKNIPIIEQFSKEQRQLYKELVIKKYIALAMEGLDEMSYFNDFDFSLCLDNHLVAEENKPHHKTKKIKELIAVVNEDFINKAEKEIYDIVIKTKPSKYSPQIKGNGITSQITKKLSIINLAQEFGLEVDSKGFAVCPFHNDIKPSLKFYENQGRFCCFGCQVKGNIIVFYALMKKLSKRVKDEI